MKKFRVILFAAALCLMFVACGKENESKAEEETTAAVSEETAGKGGLTYPGAVRVSVPGSEECEYFGIMHGVFLDVQPEENGNPVLTIRDDEDPENAWTVDTTYVKDVAVKPERGGRAALFFYGDIENDPDGVETFAVWPDGKYSIRVADGMTRNETVDDFEVWETGSGSGLKIRFIKNNCLADKETIGTGESVRVRVVYVDSGADEKYPLRIFRITEGE